MQVFSFVLITLLIVTSTLATKAMPSLISKRGGNKNLHKWKDVLPVDDNTIVAGNTATVTKTSSPVTTVAGSSTTNFLHMAILFTLWYAFNAGFNVYNAHMKRDFHFPWASAALQLVVGVLFRAIPLWSLKLRKLPKITLDDLWKILPIAILNAAGHACTVVAMFQKGGGSFTHVIKASEPVVSVILALLVNRIVPKPLTAISLLPITYGVAFASTLGNLNVASMSKEFTTVAAKMAMASNVAFSMRSILRKNLPKDFQQRTNLDAVNEFALTTLLSFLLLLPFVFRFENISAMVSSLQALTDVQQRTFWINTVLCGGCFYMYNELQNVVLGSLGAVPTAVGNTLKRVVIFVALYFFTPGETFPLPKILGCAIAIAGCFGFAIFDSLKI